MDTLDRNLAIRQGHEEGASYADLARKYDLSRARIQQICDMVKDRPRYAEPYKIRHIRQAINSAQVRLSRMVVDINGLAGEVAELERLLNATLFTEDAENGTDEKPRTHL